MKKRILAIVFVIALVASSLLILAACNDGNDGNLALVYEKKYIKEAEIHYDAGNQDYYVFHKDGYCYYRHFGEYNDYEWNDELYENIKIGTAKVDYTIEYRYTFADDDKSAIVYFYNGVTDNSTYTDTNGNVTPLKDSSWSNYSDDYLPKNTERGLLTVSKNVLCSAGSSGYTFYINEDYVKALPNFNNTTSED